MTERRARSRLRNGTYNAGVGRDKRPDKELREPGEHDHRPHRIDGSDAVREETDERAPHRRRKVEHRHWECR